MTDTMFRLLERHQKLDALLRLAQRKRVRDPFEIARLNTRKRRIRDRLSRLFAPAMPLFMA